MTAHWHGGTFPAVAVWANEEMLKMNFRRIAMVRHGHFAVFGLLLPGIAQAEMPKAVDTSTTGSAPQRLPGFYKCF